MQELRNDPASHFLSRSVDCIIGSITRVRLGIGSRPIRRHCIPRPEGWRGGLWSAWWCCGPRALWRRCSSRPQWRHRSARTRLRRCCSSGSVWRCSLCWRRQAMGATTLLRGGRCRRYAWHGYRGNGAASPAIAAVVLVLVQFCPCPGLLGLLCPVIGKPLPPRKANPRIMLPAKFSQNCGVV